MSSNDNHPAGAQDVGGDVDIALHDLDDENVTQVRGTRGSHEATYTIGETLPPLYGDSGGVSNVCGD